MVKLEVNWNATEIPGVYKRNLPKFIDNRGSIEKLIGNFDSDSFPEIHWRETMITRSKKGVVRGFHVPISQSEGWKIITCVEGEIDDLTLDLRFDSPTYRFIQKINLKSSDPRQILIAPGIAHGIQSITESMIVYSTELQNHKAQEISINPNCYENWSVDLSLCVLSEKDKRAVALGKIPKTNWNLIDSMKAFSRDK